MAAMNMRNWLHVGCTEGHDWQSVGGCNAGCSEWCGCSVPVNRCSRCGDWDYGENDDARRVRENCTAER